MMILVKTDNHVTGSAQRSAEVQAEVEQSLSRFADRITRVELKYFDDNSREKGGENDLRCVIEVRLAGLDPIMVSHEAGNLQQATDGAIERMKKTLDRRLGKLNHHKGRVSYSGDQVWDDSLLDDQPLNDQGQMDLLSTELLPDDQVSADQRLDDRRQDK